jgi:hypothetical protein
MVWVNLNSDVLYERYKIIKKLINSKYIIDVGNCNHLSYENNIEIYKTKKITTVDILDSNYKIKKKISVNHYKNRASHFIKSNVFNNLKKKNYNLIIFGLNLVPLGENYENSQKEIAALYELAINAKRIFLEYSVNFWASKIESEILISFLSKKILFFRTKTYKNFPFYAATRNLVVFDNIKNRNSLRKFISNFLKIRFNNYLSTDLKKVEFKKFEINYNNVKISSALKYTFKIIFNSKIFIFGIGKPWSYILTLNNNSGKEINYQLSFCGLFKNLLIGLSNDNIKLTHEVSLNDLEDRIIKVKILPKQSAIIRLGTSPFFLFLILKIK